MAGLPEVVTSDALELHAFSSTDAHEGFGAATESVVEIQRWLWWAQEPFTQESYTEFVRLQSENFTHDVEWRYFVFDRVSGELVGACSVELANSSGEASANLGYWIRTSLTSQNLATQTARLLASVVFKFFADVTSVEIGMDVANVASARVPHKLGFTLRGEFDKAIIAPGHTGRGLIWSVNRSDWTCEEFSFISTP